MLNAGIKTYSVTTREKDVEKLREKIERKQAEGTPYSALEDIEDLAGVRIVTYLESQREPATRLVYKEFESSRPKVEGKYNPKGYRGTHLVLYLDESREKLSEYSRFKGLKCEVQISSILYHAWSEIEHDVIYKPGADRERLESLGLDDIEASFQDIMAQKLEEATIQFDLLYNKHKEVLAAGKVIYSDYLSEIFNAESNDKIASILDIAGKFAYKKPEEALRIAEATTKRASREPQVIGEFGERQIFGKTHTSLLINCIEIFRRVRYGNVERILSSLFALSLHGEDAVSKKALEVIKSVAKYDYNFLKEHKNLYPQRASLDYIRKIPEADRLNLMPAITAVVSEVLSSSIEGTEWSSADTVTFHSGALQPNEGLKKMRHEAMGYVVDLYAQVSSTQDRLALIKVLLAGLRTPHHAAYGDDLVEMILEDSRRLSSVLATLLRSESKVSRNPIAQEVEEDIILLLQSDRLKSDELQTLYDQLRNDADYAAYCTLVGDIQRIRGLDENWDAAAERRSSEVDSLAGQVSEDTVDEWYKKLCGFAEPLVEGAVEEWKYHSFRVFITRLAEAKPELASVLFDRALAEGSSLCHSTFVTTYLTALRRKNDFKAWDAFVATIRDRKLALLAASAVISLNLDKCADLSASIREEDIAMLDQLVEGSTPFEFTKRADDSEPQLRHALISTLERLYAYDKARVEALIVAEIRNHPKWRHVYFGELPLASHRKWMSFRDWSPAGVAFIKEQLVELADLDWHVQEMMLGLGDDPVELILDVFKSRIERERGEVYGRYDEVPFHFNPNLQKYLAEHPSYVGEMVRWLREIPPDGRTYNWHVSQFIQRIGGVSYSTILMHLIEAGDTESLKRAAYALNAFEGADLVLCFEIVKRTDNKEILSQVGSAMSGTGVVSGEYGFSEAFEKKAKALEPYAASEDKRVSTFANEMKKTFEERARSEYERSTVGKKTRKLEFEG